MGAAAFGLGTPFTSFTTPQQPWMLSPYTQQFAASPFGASPYGANPLQQILQAAQTVPYQLQQLQQLAYLQQQQLQQLAYVIPTQLAQLHQLIGTPWGIGPQGVGAQPGHVM